MGLRWEDVSLGSGLIHVRRSWDEKAGAVEPKSRAGKRTIPILGVLREMLIEHRMLTDRSNGFVFGPTLGRPFTPSAAWRRAHRRWRTARLSGVGLHEARHAFASLLIASGVNAKAITSYMGHSSVSTTFDLYGHLMPGSEGEAAALVDAFLEKTLTPHDSLESV